MRVGVLGSALVVLACTTAGCEESRPVDPEARLREGANESALVPPIALDELIGAMAGVSRDAAPSVLERWLRDAKAPLLAAWPRTPEGALDLSHPPVKVASVEASIGPGSRSRCGEVVVELAGPVAPRLRAHLAIPKSAPQCRGITRESRRTGVDAMPLLDVAIAYARVPAGLSLPISTQ